MNKSTKRTRSFSRDEIGDAQFYANQRETWAAYYTAIGRPGLAAKQARKAAALRRGLETRLAKNANGMTIK